MDGWFRTWWQGRRGLRLGVQCVLACLSLLGASAAAQPSGEPVPGGRAVAVANRAENVAIVTIRGPIDAYTARSVARRIRAAEAAGADALVFELDTPGGELKSCLEICNAIKGTTVPLTVAWINPDAYSAGAIIALACRQIVVSDPATMGDALPIVGSPLGTFQGFNSLPEHERQKVMSPLVAEVVNSARRNGYDEMLVQAIVSRGVELWLVRDTATGALLAISAEEYALLFDRAPERSSPRLPSAAAGVEGPVGPRLGPGGVEGEPLRPPPLVREDDFFRPASESLAGIAERVNEELTERTTRPVIRASDRGRYELVMYLTDGAGPVVMKSEDMRALGLASAVVRGDDQLRAYFGASNVRRLDETWSEGLARFMSSWQVRFLLVVVFLIALFVEMTHPGATIPGVISVLALVALVAPSMIVGMASWWGIAAIVCGVALLAVELFVVPGFGAFGFGGILLLFGGLLGVIMPGGDRLFPGEPGAKGGAFYGAAMLLAAVVTSGVLIYFLTKHLGSLPVVNRLVLKDEPVGGTLAAMLSENEHPLMGLQGRAMTDLRPAGRAEIDGRMIDVVSELGYIPAGTTVRVVTATQIRIGVEAVSEPRSEGSGAA